MKTMISKEQIMSDKTAAWFVELGTSRRERFISERLMNRNEDLPLIYTLTVTYNCKGTYSGKADTKLARRINQTLKSVYRMIIRSNGNKHWQRYPEFHPVCIAYIDVSGSKHGRKTAHHISDDPHHHGTLFLHPDHARKFQLEGHLNQLKAAICSKIKEVKTIDIQVVDTRVELRKWANYSAKYDVKVARDPRVSDETLSIFVDGHCI